MSDPRLSWLVSSPLAGLIASSGGSSAAIGSDPSVLNWLNQTQTKLLSAYTIKGEKGIKFTNEIGALAQSQSPIDQEVHLMKMDSAAASSESAEDFGRSVLITNTVGDALQGLYQIIHSVFAPKLLGSGEHTHTHVTLVFSASLDLCLTYVCFCLSPFCVSVGPMRISPLSSNRI